ncbi:TonB-dependent receptor plug domain-containing protein [Sphingosinicella rhizophila]|uniref:TonB-dependent receptor plug domain-containing protein n=1 Tax=Sphingosinicella rhizophila TaxID=3050082 RepID=A0ABU3QAY6_9SPHN|nr:TonB-dependent receptor plug domain-containing protein [Sphingosinicella sp. GR2756]MDT9600566.1 TonB-dependent receptor plug domain-containing protein [Sphingosinicella sp. GR2756]
MAQPLAAQLPSDPAVAMPPVVSQAGGRQVFTPADFARFAPRNALDMLRQVPGFTIREAKEERGLGQASENVLLNGQRVPSKSGGAVAELQKIPATGVERIEIVDAATLDIAGLSGQVANIVAKSRKGGGQFNWWPEFRARFTDPLFTRGDISYSGQAGRLEYAIGVNNPGNRSGAGGGTRILDPQGVPFEFRHDIWHTHSDEPKFSARLTLDGTGSSLANLNLAVTPRWYDYWETGERVRPGGVDQHRDVHQERDGYTYEIGGDYAFDLGPGRLKLIGLRKFEHEPLVTTAITRFADSSPATGDRVSRDGRYGEWIGRAEYGWRMAGGDWQVSAEGAFNRLDSVTRIFLLDADEDFVEIPFPAGTGRVQEDRYEMLVTHGRPLSRALTLQAVLGAEYSKLGSASGIGSLTRNFIRPKGSLSLAWQPNEDLDVSLRIRRRVWQLDFYDFLASANLIEGQVNAGNIDLVPPQSWELEVEATRKLGRWGTTKLRLYGNRIDDIVDIVPIGVDGESPGNVHKAVQHGVEWKSTFLFDTIGWKGAKLDTLVQFQRSRLDDPLTGARRRINKDLVRMIDLTLRHDVPNSSWAWGGNLNHGHYSLTYRLTEFGLLEEGPVWLNLFIEHKNVFGFTVRARAANLLNARSRWDRIVYTGRRTGPVDYIEDRNRMIGPIFDFSVRGNF